MKTIPLRDLRNDYAGVLRQVEEGETFTVTRDGKPIASLTPYVDPGAEGPQTWVPARTVIGALAHLGPGLGRELRRDLDEDFDTDAEDPFERRGSSEPQRARQQR